MRPNNARQIAARFLVVLVLAGCVDPSAASNFFTPLPTPEPAPSASLAQRAASPIATAVAPPEFSSTPSPTAVFATTATPTLTETATPATTSAATGTPTLTDNPTPTGTLTPQRTDPADALLKLINEKRAASRVPALTWSSQLARAAQSHAEDCARRNKGSHVGSDGAVLVTRLARAGYVTRTASEIWANARNVQGAFDAWWSEVPANDVHHRNIIDPHYKEVGIGIARGGWGFYFIVDFASR